MSPAGRLLLNRRLVQAPIDAIDYVISHELSHVAEPHHGAAFFELLDKVMPDWGRRKQRLERARENGFSKASGGAGELGDQCSPADVLQFSTRMKPLVL